MDRTANQNPKRESRATDTLVAAAQYMHDMGLENTPQNVLLAFRAVRDIGMLNSFSEIAKHQNENGADLEK